MLSDCSFCPTTHRLPRITTGRGFLALCLAVVLGAASATTQDKLLVFVSVLPQKTFVERVGGARVQVETMVPPGHSPATYEPTPRQVSALANADLYLRTGVPFEDAWMARIRAVNPDMPIVDLRQDIQLREMEAHHRHPHNEDAPLAHGRTPGIRLDPHIWTSPPLVKRMARSIRDQLIAQDPTHRLAYMQNHDVFAADLDALDRDIRRRLSGIGSRRFMVFHPAWGYFADTYALVQVPVEVEGKEPGPSSLTRLVEQARREGVKVVFVQPQFGRKTAQRVAQAIGGRVETIDPLAADYFANLQRVARLIAEGNSP